MLIGDQVRLALVEHAAALCILAICLGYGAFYIVRRRRRRRDLSKFDIPPFVSGRPQMPDDFSSAAYVDRVEILPRFPKRQDRLIPVAPQIHNGVTIRR